MVKDVVGSRLKQLRKMKSITVATVSETLGIVPRTYSSYERGERMPDMDTLCRISEFYGVQVEYLLGKDINDESNQIDNIMKRVSERDRDTFMKYLSLPEDLRRQISDLIKSLSEHLSQDHSSV